MPSFEAYRLGPGWTAGGGVLQESSTSEREMAISDSKTEPHRKKRFVMRHIKKSPRGNRRRQAAWKL